MIVVDTNILVSFYVHDNHTVAVRKLKFDDPEWLAPELWRSEMRNALTLIVRQGFLKLDYAIDTLREAEAMMRHGERKSDSEEVLRLAQSSGCSAHDCEYVALALSASTRLYTFDKRVLRAFPEVAHRPES